MSSVVPTQRIRLSIWVGATDLDEKVVAGAAGIVDDLTLIFTIANDETTNRIGYEIMMTADRGAREAAACHKFGVQCLAGFQLTGSGVKKGPRTQRFESFLKTASNDQIDAFAKEMVAKLDEPTTKGPRTPTQRFDGLGFDNESVSDVSLRDKLTRLYRAVATELVKGDGSGGRFVSVAAGPLSSPTQTVLPCPEAPGGGKAEGFVLNHPYEMSAGLSNLVVRPMCYDTFSANPPTTAATRDRWHGEILDYAVGKGIHNGNKPATRAAVFQMGFKNAPGFHNNPANAGKVDENGNKFQNLDGIVDAGTEMEAVCWHMRQHGVGVVLFAFPPRGDAKTKQPKPEKQYLAELAEYYKKIARYNFALNGAATSDGPDWTRFDAANPTKDTRSPGTADAPAQAPIGADGQKRLGKP